MFESETGPQHKTGALNTLKENKKRLALEL
jgi:hypothetical protein